MKSVPIKDSVAHLDALWRGLTVPEMKVIGRQLKEQEKAKKTSPKLEEPE